MKKIISVIAAVLFSVPACISVCAAETVSEAPGNADLPIYARYADNTGFNIVPTDEKGTGGISLPDGTEITVSGADKANSRLVVEEITEKEALDWIAGQLKDKADDARAYHVFWLNDDGSSQPTDGVKMSIRQAENTADAVFSLNGERASKLNAGIKNGTVTFTTDGSSFYALCKGSVTTEPEVKPPQTGDNGDLFLWITLLFVSGGIITYAAVEGKRKKAQDRQ